MSNNLSIIKTSSVTNAVLGEIITYNLMVKNNGTVDVKNVLITDLLNPALEFIDNSVRINNISSPSDNITSGVEITKIIVGAIYNITFDAKVLGIGSVSNQAKGSYYYLGGANNNEQYGSAISNINTVLIEDVSLNINKSVNKDFAVLGDIVNYTIILHNNGNLDVNNVFIVDNISKNLAIIDGTIAIDGIVVNNADLNKGINIGAIKKGEIKKITYSAKVVGIACNGKIANAVKANYAYNLSDGSLGKGFAQGNGNEIVNINLGINNFKQFSIEENLTIPVDKPDIEEILSVVGEIEIIKSHTIKTPIGNSNEGQNLLGYKIVIYGRLNQVVEYTALDSEQSVHSTNYSIPFTTFIVLPNNYSIGKTIELSGYTEHIYFNQTSTRALFSNATILIKAILCNGSN